jgi:cytochrome b pre-mRNA-processing protein 3
MMPSERAWSFGQPGITHKNKKMLARTTLSRSLTRSLTTPTRSRIVLRCLSTTTGPQKTPKTWLSRKLESSPAAKQWFLSFTNLLGYGSPKQLAGRRAFVLYEHIVAAAPDQYPEFWQKG